MNYPSEVRRMQKCGVLFVMAVVVAEVLVVAGLASAAPSKEGSQPTKPVE